LNKALLVRKMLVSKGTEMKRNGGYLWLRFLELASLKLNGRDFSIKRIV
jgi:protein involved in temperature-dependent protein secretion